MGRIARAAAALALALASLAAAGQGGIGFDDADLRFGVDAFVGTPSAYGDAFRSAFFGASLRYRLSRHLEVSLDYAFMETEYYYPEGANGPWAGPVPWSSVPERYAGMQDSWIFYHTKHFLSPQLWYIEPLDRLGLPLALRIGAGPALSFLIPSEAAEYYPGLSDAFELFTESFEAYLGLSLRLGVEYRPWRFLRVGAEYLFIVDSFSEMAGDIGHYGFGYFDRAGNFLVFVGARI